MQNTRGRYIPILPVVLITATPDGPTQIFQSNFTWYQIIYLLRGGYYNLYMLRLSSC